MRHAIAICHLYPELLNLYGDRGNILTLSRRLSWRGIAVTVHSVSLGEPYDPEAYDITFLGGGQDFEQDILQHDLLREKSGAIRHAILSDRVFLCICGGYQVLGMSYITASGREIPCLRALDIHTKAGGKRLIGNLVFSLLSEEAAEKNYPVIGFENHSGRTVLGREVKPLGKVLKGFGNNGEDGTEGALWRNVFCSYAHGSLLPKNPALADMILLRALRRKYPGFTREELPPLDDTLEEETRRGLLPARLLRRGH